MPYIITPGRMAAYPTGPAPLSDKVNWGFVKSHSQLWTPGNKDKATSLTVTGNPSIVGTVYGTGTQFGSGKYLTTPAGIIYDSAGAGGDIAACRMQILVFAPLSNAAQTTIASIGGSATDGGPRRLLQNNSGTLRWYSNVATYQNLGAAIVGKRHVVVERYSDFSPYTTTVFLDGVAKYSANNYYSSLGAYSIYIGSGYPTQFNGVIYQHIFAQGVLWSDAQIADFSERPIEYLRTSRRLLYFGAGAGGGDTNLIFSDSTQTQTTDAAVLVTSSFLVVQEATQNHSSENVVLDASVSTNLIVADATQTHTSENSILQVSTNLVIDDSTQPQTSDNITLTSVHSLIIQECIQDQTSENITLDSGLILTVADCIQGQTAENVIILASSLLLINDATQDQTSENLSFTLATNISVNDSTHSISSESPNLTIPGSGTGATVEEIVDGIMAALLAETIPVNIKKINDVLVYGIGTDGNPWRESA